jgi:hypothetical protein
VMKKRMTTTPVSRSRVRREGTLIIYRPPIIIVGYMNKSHPWIIIRMVEVSDNR